MSSEEEEDADDDEPSSKISIMRLGFRLCLKKEN